MMTKSVVRLTLVGVLLVAIATPALDHHGNRVLWPQTPTKSPAKAADLPTLMADGPDPIPWPRKSTKPPAKAADLPTLTADGPDPIPWPTPTTTTKPPEKAARLV